MEITTPNIDASNQIGPDLRRRNASVVSFETVNYDPNAPKPAKKSFWGSVFSALGAFAPLGFLFPPIGIPAALAGMGLGGIGNKMKANAAANSQQNYKPMPMGYPGLAQGPVQMDSALVTISSSRDTALYSSSREIR